MAGPTENELRILALYHQLRALSDSEEVGAMVIITAPASRIVQSVSLSPSDLDAVTEALASLNAAKAATEETTRPGEGLPQVDGDDVDEIVSGFEALLKGEGGQPA